MKYKVGAAMHTSGVAVDLQCMIKHSIGNIKNMQTKKELAHNRFPRSSQNQIGPRTNISRVKIKWLKN